MRAAGWWVGRRPWCRFGAVEWLERPQTGRFAGLAVLDGLASGGEEP